MKRRHGDVLSSSPSIPFSSSSQHAAAVPMLPEDDTLSLKSKQDKPPSLGANLAAAKDKLREANDSLTSAVVVVRKQMKKDITLKNELSNLYTELLGAKEAESDDRKKQKCFERGIESEKGLGNKDGVAQNEVGAAAAAQPVACDDTEVTMENERGGVLYSGGAKEEDERANNNKVDDDTVMVVRPSSSTCESSNKMKGELTTVIISPTREAALSDEPPVVRRWMALDDVYASTGNAEKIAELVEVQAAQTGGDGNQLEKQQDSPLSPDKEDWDNDDSWRILDPLNVVNEALAVEVLGTTRSYDVCDSVNNFFSIVPARDGTLTHEKKWRDNDAIMCPFELNGVCDDDGCQYLHNNISRNNTPRRCKRAHILQELSLPVLIPFCELICMPLATITTSTPVKTAAPQLPPRPQHPLMDQQQPAFTSVETTPHAAESLGGFVPLSPSTGDDESEEDEDNEKNVTTIALEDVASVDLLHGSGGDDYIGGVVESSHVIYQCNDSIGDGEEKFSSDRLGFTANVVNIQPWVVALSHSICAPPTTTELLLQVLCFEGVIRPNVEVTLMELSQLEAFLVAHPENSGELWLLYVLYLLPRAQGDDSPGAILRAASIANPTLLQLSCLEPGSLNPALRALARALNYPSSTSCEALWVLYLCLKESCTPISEKSQHRFIQLHSHALQAIPLSPRIWAMRLDFVRQHCGALPLFSTLQEAYSMLLDTQAFNNNSASVASMYMFLVMYTVRSMLKSGRKNAAAAFLCSILNIEAEWEEGDIELNIDAFRPIEIALHILSAIPEQRALLWITLAHVLAFGSIPRPADSLAAAPPSMDGQCHQRTGIDFLFSLLKWERGLLESKAFPRLRRLPHLLALLRRVLYGSVRDIFSLGDEYGSGITCSSTTEDSSSPAYPSVESFLPQSVQFDCPPVYKSVIISNLLCLEMGLDDSLPRIPGRSSHLSSMTVLRSLKLVEKACSKTGLMMNVIRVIHQYLPLFSTEEERLVKALEFVLMLTAQSSSNNKDVAAAIQMFKIFLGENVIANNLSEGDNLNDALQDLLFRWTDSGFHQESEAKLRSILDCVKIVEGSKSAISLSFHVVSASGFSNMDPALRRLVWLCVLELCIENSSGSSSMSTMEGGDDHDIAGEPEASMFNAATMEEEKENSQSTTNIAQPLVSSSVPLNMRLDPTLVVLRALDPSELIPSPYFTPECTTIEKSVLTTIGASDSPSHFELEAYICRILKAYIEHRQNNIHWEFVDALLSEHEGGDTVARSSGSGGNALRVAPVSSLLLFRWILGAQTHERSLSLAAQIKQRLCAIAIGGGRKGSTECSVLSRVAAAAATQLGDHKAAQRSLCTSLEYEPSHAGLWEQLAWIQARYAPLQTLKKRGRALGVGASNAGVVLNLKCKGDGPLKTEAASASLRQLLSCSHHHCNPPPSSLNLAKSLVFPSVPCSILLLTGLQKLSLEGNALMSLPKGMDRLSHLRILDISNNNLKFLPLCVWSLSSLEALRMAKNLFTSLPNEVEKLQNMLIELDLSGNSGLGKIPQVVLTLTKLQTLKVRCCSIKSRGIPLDLTQRLPVLCELDIEENPCLAAAADV